MQRRVHLLKEIVLFCVCCFGFGFVFFKESDALIQRELFLTKAFFIRDNCDKRAFHFLDVTKISGFDFIRLLYSNLQRSPAVFFAQSEYKKWKASQIRINCHQMKLEIWNSNSSDCKWHQNLASPILGDSFE